MRYLYSFILALLCASCAPFWHYTTEVIEDGLEDVIKEEMGIEIDLNGKAPSRTQTLYKSSF